ncbi:MAG: signal peptidase I [Chloroflexota bacterium]|nr:signal peptidase I [Chloroflexota bacterium]MDE2941276.1 signal peptidase I [Chloroflexota bacterium]MDE3267790.1 signal peptidase I [Chloroflexota bacterium]
MSFATIREFVTDILETVSLALLIFFLLQSSVRNYRVELSSMEPTLSHEDRLIVNKLVYFNLFPEAIDRLLPFVDIWEEDSRLYPFHAPKRAEVIVFRYPHDPTRDFVKRVIGLPGETVSIQRGTVYIDGELLDEPYLIESGLDNLAPVLVPPNSYFVMGDNRRGSSDSRHWGPVSIDNVVGKVVVRYWPFSEFSLVSEDRPFTHDGAIDNR